MNDDRELTELAAKAAGYRIEWVSTRLDDNFTARIRNENPYWFNWPAWNPIDDDGDAFRLAVKLKMDVTVGQSVKVVCATNDYGASRVVLPLADDPCAATRRAIVEAAAEIGKKIDAPLVRAD